MQPWNLLFRFVLELTALAGIGIGAWASTDGWVRWVLAVTAPVVAAAIWGTFNVPGDPSRSGRAPVPVPGWVRLTLEIAVFAAGGFSLWVAGIHTLVWIYLVALVVHHVASINRLRWLLGDHEASIEEIRP